MNATPSLPLARTESRSNFSQKSMLMLLVLLISSSNVLADTKRHDKTCKRLHAEIVAALKQEGCDSQFSLCTAGTIDGNRGLNGTTAFSADSIASGPTTAPDSPATMSYSGILTITTPEGTLSVRDTGIFNTATPGLTPTAGFFASFDLILPEGNTGRFAGATGTFVTAGKTVNGEFVSEVEGVICFEHK